ncbi:uncharacterized protein KY384_000969 [Bacidia gigantensis]|uniref:uncharacterized protein n=1 Tax=Bacidia gigantensis TaxID=2732470 RepID=UPI001D04C03C|nr:uncharacterized protein KY384_000969 [Bacidia gigantensis]KAG8534125.1 hypothetical protein KY384_000969 [Bacidia gigantensis]
MLYLSSSTALALLLLQCFNPVLSESSTDNDESSSKDLKPCTINNPNNNKFYDLNTITVPPIEKHHKKHKDDKIESWHARGWDYGTNFTINFCAPVIEDLKDVEGISGDAVKNISAFYKTKDRTFSIGQTSTAPIFRGRKLTLNYTNGSPCDTPSRSRSLESRKKHHDDEDDDADDDEKDSKHSKPDPRRKSTLISFLCERDSLAPKAHLSFIGASPDECTYFFEARSMAACGGR